MDDTIDTTPEFDPVAAFAHAFTTTDAEPEKEKPSKEEADEKHEDPKGQEKKPEDQADEDADQSDDEVQDEEGEDEGSDEGEDADKGEDEKSYADDAVFVKVKVDGEEREFAVKDLKRLAGQEASLTRKSQEVATQRKQIEDRATLQSAQVEALLKRARERWEPYSKVNLLVAAKTLEPEQLEALQADMQARWDDVQYLEKESTNVLKQINDTKKDALVKSAQECIKTLSDPHTGIEGWNEQLYGDLCKFAKDEGMDADMVNSLTDPSAFKILHMAHSFKKAQQKVQVAKDTKTTAKKAPPKKIIKKDASSSADATRKIGRPNKSEAAIKRLENTGSRDDAANAFAAMWTADSDE